MKKLYLSIIFLSLLISGCKFGEYANTDPNNATSSSVENGQIVYKFKKENVENKTFFKVYKTDNKFNIAEYDFNTTHYKKNMIFGNKNSIEDKYKISDEGYLKLSLDNFNIWVKPINDDKEKISLLWTQSKDDLNSTTPSPDTYFFTNLQKAKVFIQDK